MMKRAVLTLGLLGLLGIASLPAQAKNVDMQTTLRGALTVAVTDIPSQDLVALSWTDDFLQAFAEEEGLILNYVVVPFDKAWELAAKGEVDVVATGMSALPERTATGAQWSQPYLEEKRGLRIHAKDSERFHTIQDFVGHRVGVLANTTSEQDLKKRAPQGVDIVVSNSRKELHQLFNEGKIDAIAEGFYASISNKLQQQSGQDLIIDTHDLVPGKPEKLVFVVYEGDKGLLSELDTFLKSRGFPVKKSHA